MKTVIIRVENKEDENITENLIRDAFYDLYRPRAIEHYVLHNTRKNRIFIKNLNLVIEENGEIIAHIMYVESEVRCETSSL